MSRTTGHPLKRDGTSQRQRLLEALKPENNPVEGRDSADLLAMLYKLADEFVYYNDNNEADQGWKTFFPVSFSKKDDIPLVEKARRYISEAESNHDQGPFMTLILVFLHLYQYLKDDINQLTAKHLKFYYEQVLGFKRRPAKPDKAHIVFELNPSHDQFRIEQGTRLRVKPNVDGSSRTYVTTREIVVNRTQLAEIKSAMIDEQGKIHIAERSKSLDGMGDKLSPKFPYWPAFGDPQRMVESNVGLALTSHLFLLREGERIITLTLSFVNTPDLQLFNSLEAYVSIESGWQKLGVTAKKEDATPHSIILTIIARVDHPPIVSAEEDILGKQLNSNAPILKLEPDLEEVSFLDFDDYQIKKIECKVEVKVTDKQTGIQKLVLQNDLSVLDSSGSFQPFGPRPSTNSTFLIGSQEVFSKPLESLSLRWQWADLPKHNLTHYYGNYEGKFTYEAPHVACAIRSKGSWHVEPKRSFELFAKVEESNKESTSPFVEDIKSLPDLAFVPSLEDFDEFSPHFSQGFLKLELLQTFGHLEFPTIFASNAREAKELPSPPYTPTIRSLSLGYKTKTIVTGKANADLELIHIHPFGNSRVDQHESFSLFPTIGKGNLYLGLKDYLPGQNLSFLFQVAAGSNGLGETIQSNDINWFYLSNEHWESIEQGAIITDSTNGLQQTGVIAFQLGENASKSNALFPGSLHWLVARINKTPAVAARMLDIKVQAVTVASTTAKNKKNTINQLEAQGISGLETGVVAIKKVEQPFASIGGVPLENDESFFSRVSERLRHKNRAISIWDIERLVLNEFPDIYKVKCIPHTGFDENGVYSEFLPGATTIVVVPAFRHQFRSDFLQPGTNSTQLTAIKRFIQSKCSFTLKEGIHVINPEYDPISFSFSVGFKEGYDGGYYAEELNKALQRLLSPWAFQDEEDIRFGGTWFESHILAFIEQQEYIDNILNFRMRQRIKGKLKEVKTAKTSKEISVLVSAPQHDISPLQPGEFPCDDTAYCPGGINCWYINIDFVVSPNN